MNLDDRLALLDLHAPHAQTIDSGAAQAWAECFTADGSLRTNRPLHVRGRYELERFAADWHAADHGQRRHVTWHHRFAADGDGADGTCYAALLRTGPDGVSTEFTAVYRDRYTRTPAGWAIRERSVALDRVSD
jgi:hypothetical protein